MTDSEKLAIACDLLKDVDWAGRKYYDAVCCIWCAGDEYGDLSLGLARYEHEGECPYLKFKKIMGWE